MEALEGFGVFWAVDDVMDIFISNWKVTITFKREVLEVIFESLC